MWLSMPRWLVILLIAACMSRVSALSRLPSPLIGLNTAAGQELLQDCTSKRAFNALIQTWETQVTQDWCGLAAAATVLNALPVPKPEVYAFDGYPWFFQQNMLETTNHTVITQNQVEEWGIGLATLQRILAAHTGVVAVMQKTDPAAVSLEEFREYIASALTSSDEMLIMNFDRYTVMSRGGGHHSPLGAYNAVRDMVLVLDVARYRYPPFWAPLELLYDATATDAGLDEGNHRGLIRISAKPNAMQLPLPSQYRKRPERSDRDDISSLASSTEEQRGPSSGTMWAVGVLGPLIGAVVAIGAYLAIDRLKERARLLGHSRLATGDVEDKRGFQLAAFRTASDT